MKKFIVISSLLLCMLIGCSNTKKINMSETAIKIMKTYDLNLASVRDDVFDTIYFLDKDSIIDRIIYIDPLSRADHIAIMEVKDYKKVEADIKKSLEAFRRNYELYLPEEISKIEKYQLEVVGNYIFIIVSDKENIDISKCIVYE